MTFGEAVFNELLSAYTVNDTHALKSLIKSAKDNRLSILIYNELIRQNKRAHRAERKLHEKRRAK